MNIRAAFLLLLAAITVFPMALQAQDRDRGQNYDDLRQWLNRQTIAAEMKYARVCKK